MTSLPLTQPQRSALVDTSLALLLQPEAQQLVDVVSAGDPGRRRLALRALLAMRPAIPLPAELNVSLERLLAAEAAERETVDALSLPRPEVDPRLSLWRGDITTIRADAIVNAANSTLLGCFQPLHACIDNAIHSAAGLALRAECAARMEQQGHPEKTGSAKITRGYNLPARYVLHTVGPIVRGTLTERDKELLASCYRSCLSCAVQHDLKSIAFCCISTGEFHFPNKEAAEIAVHEVRAFLAQNKTMERVVFNVFKDEDKEIYERLLS